IERKDSTTDIVTPTPPVPVKGALLLRGIPSAELFVDDTLRGNNTGQFLKVPITSGNHRVLFKNAAFGSHGLWRVPVSVGEKETKRFTCYFESYVSIGVRGESEWGTVM